MTRKLDFHPFPHPCFVPVWDTCTHDRRLAKPATPKRCRIIRKRYRIEPSSFLLYPSNRPIVGTNAQTRSSCSTTQHDPTREGSGLEGAAHGAGARPPSIFYYVKCWGCVFRSPYNPANFWRFWWVLSRGGTWLLHGLARLGWLLVWSAMLRRVAGTGDRVVGCWDRTC